MHSSAFVSSPRDPERVLLTYQDVRSGVTVPGQLITDVSKTWFILDERSCEKLL